MSEKINVVILGASGKMGENLIKTVDEHSVCCLHAAIVRKESSVLAQPVNISSDVPINFSVMDAATIQSSDVLIDFSSPEATLTHAALAVEHKKPIVIGTTGFSDEQLAQLEAFSKQVPLVVAPNMAIGVNVMLKALGYVSRLIGQQSDIEIIESHHRYKKDAPSGTALKMGEVIAQAQSLNFNDVAQFSYDRVVEKRDRKTIGFSSIRAGNVIGEHQALFALEGEQIEISHKSSSRQVYAQGAVEAAIWLIKQPNGFYDMQDVLNLND